jgi:predicted alpha/beta-fold hydrolase
MLNGELVTTVTSDGLELAGFWMDQKSDIAVFHTHGTAGDFYTHKFIEVEGEALSAKNISFLSANNRGHDVFADIRKHNSHEIGWTLIGGGLERFEDCVFDISAWIEFLEKRGVKKFILQGHSLGPNKTIYYQYKKQDPRIVGFIHLSPQNDAGLMRDKLGETEYLRVNSMIKDKIESGKEREMIPKELEELCPMSVLTYSGYFIEEGIANLFPYHNPANPNWKVLHSITQPQILVYGETDPYIKPSVSTGIEVFGQKVNKASKLEDHMIGGASHSYVGYEKELANVINSWMNTVCK